jgi:UDP-N-acetylglucosamine acyltransferase
MSNPETNTIHPSAILEGNIQMGSGNYIGPNVVMRGNIELGNNNYIDAGTVLQHNVIIGNDNFLYPYAVVGALGEMGLKGDFFNEEGAVRIGNHVTIRNMCVFIHLYIARKQSLMIMLI